MEFDLNYKINPKINTLALLTQYEIDDLIKYLYTLNQNIQWFEIIQKHLNTNNEKFIKHLKPLLWEDHTKNDDYNSEFELKGNPKLKNTFNKLSLFISSKTVMITSSISAAYPPAPAACRRAVFPATEQACCPKIHWPA